MRSERSDYAKCVFVIRDNEPVSLPTSSECGEQSNVLRRGRSAISVFNESMFHEEAVSQTLALERPVTSSIGAPGS